MNRPIRNSNNPFNLNREQAKENEDEIIKKKKINNNKQNIPNNKINKY